MGAIRCKGPGGGGGLVTQSCPTLATPRSVACRGPLSMGFSKQEHWSGLLFPSPVKDLHVLKRKNRESNGNLFLKLDKQG